MAAAGKRRIRWSLRIAIAAALVSIGLLVRHWITSNRAPEDSNLLARVGSVYLRAPDLIRGAEFPDSSRLKRLVEHWVETELLAQAAIAEGIDSDPMIKRRADEFRRDLLADSYLRFASVRIPDVSEEEIEAYYDTHTSGFVLDRPEVKAYHFLLDSRSDAANLAIALRTGNSAARAELLSKYHGEVKSFAPDAILDELSRAVFTTRRPVVGPIRTVYGFHIFDIISRRNVGAVRPIEEVRDEIRSQIMISSQKRFHYELLDNLKAAADFEIFEQRLAYSK